MDLVSILIPAFKHDFIRECIESAISQKWVEKEIIVSDDSSGPLIESICKEYAPFIHYCKSSYPESGGLNNLINLYYKSKGKYLKYLFDDDVLDPNCVLYLKQALDKTATENTTLAFSNRNIINKLGRCTNSSSFFKTRVPLIIPGQELVKIMALEQKNVVGELTTVMFRKEDLSIPFNAIQVSPSEKFVCRGLVDVTLFMSLLERGNAVFLPEKLSSFRRHAMTNSNPEYNSEWIHAVTDWSAIVKFGINNKIISKKKEILKTYISLVRFYRFIALIHPNQFLVLDMEISKISTLIYSLNLTYVEKLFAKIKIASAYTPIHIASYFLRKVKSFFKLNNSSFGV